MKRHVWVVIAAVGCFYMIHALAADRADTTLVKVGEEAPAFTCETIDGTEFALEEQAGKVVFINFFATWCGSCVRELPHLEESIYNRYKDRGDFALIVIGREETAAKLKEFRKKKGYALPFAPDPDRGIYGKYATKWIPRNVVIGRDGVVRYAEIGFDPAQLEALQQLIEAELKKPAPEAATSRAGE